MRPVFIGGCGRSGTTLLAALLAEHPLVIAPPEAQFLVKGLGAAAAASPTQATGRFADAVRADWRLRLWDVPTVSLPGAAEHPADAMRTLARAYAAARGKPDAGVWVDHTPNNILYARTLLDAFPEAVMVHLVRDPRAVAASVIPLDWGPASPRDAARWWLARIGAGLVAETSLPDRVIRVRYEDVVRDPEAVTRLWRTLALDPPGGEGRAADGMDVPRYTRSQHMLVGARPDPERIDAWRATLPPRAVAVIESELGDALALLGYRPQTPQPAVIHPRGPVEAGAAALATVRQRVSGYLRRKRLV